MKNILLCLLSLCACLANAAQFAPMLGFPQGEYLGLGRYTGSDARTEFFSSHGEFYADSWSLSYLSGIGTSYYDLFFEFDENNTGFFTLTMNRRTPGPGSGYYQGHGYCGSHQCNLYASLEGEVLQESITFHPETNAIYRLGSLHSTLPNGSVYVVVWDEKMTNIEDNNEPEELIILPPLSPLPIFPPSIPTPARPWPVMPQPLPPSSPSR